MSTPIYPKTQFGLSLLELGMVMFIISLALIPVVKMMGGPTSSTGNASQVTGFKNKEALLANTLSESVMAGNFSRFDCTAAGSPKTLDPTTDLPLNGAFKKYNICTDNSYSTPLYYRWDALNISGMPIGNQYYQASLNVYDSATARTPLMTLPVNFFVNTGGYNHDPGKTGMLLALDTSGSMCWGSSDNTLSQQGPTCSPFMFYRYDKNRYTGTAWGVPFSPSEVPGVKFGTKRVWLNMWDNSELDIAIGKSIKSGGASPDFSDPDFSTEYNEKFPYGSNSMNDLTWGKGLLGTGNCASTNPVDWDKDPNLIHTFLPSARNRVDAYAWWQPFRSMIQNVCGAKDSDWGKTMEQNMSRLEFARAGALSLLLTLEEKQTYLNKLDIAFLPWGGNPNLAHLVKMESASLVNEVNALRYPRMRNEMLWINRADPTDPASTKTVGLYGGTNMTGALKAAVKELNSKPYSKRMIVLLTDGVPTDTTGPQLVSYIDKTFGNNAPKAQQITLYTIGITSGADETLLQQMAASTPDGQAFMADDLTQLRTIFTAIAYQVQRLMVLSTAQRYNLQLSE